MLGANELLIHDGTPEEVTHNPVVDGEPKGRGCMPRDFTVQPRTMFSPPSEIKVYDRADWPAMITEREAKKSRLSDIRLIGNAGQSIPSLDQGPNGYCWSHSTTHGVMLARAVANMPYVPLSAYAVAATIKKGRNEGGWGALSAEFIKQRGVPAQSIWPQGKRNYQDYDKPETWANAGLHRIVSEWADLTTDVYSRNLAFEQEVTCLFNLEPVVKDENHWSHSILGLDVLNGASHWNVCRAESGKLMSLQEFELAWGMNHPVTGGYGIRIWNSWSDGWSDRGMGVLTGSKAISDGAIAIRATSPSIN